jgi:hypothetical protein
MKNMYCYIKKISTAMLKNMHYNIDKNYYNNKKYLSQQPKNMYNNIEKYILQHQKIGTITSKNYAATFKKKCIATSQAVCNIRRKPTQHKKTTATQEI